MKKKVVQQFTMTEKRKVKRSSSACLPTSRRERGEEGRGGAAQYSQRLFPAPAVGGRENVKKKRHVSSVLNRRLPPPPRAGGKEEAMKGRDIYRR